MEFPHLHLLQKGPEERGTSKHLSEPKASPSLKYLQSHNERCKVCLFKWKWQFRCWQNEFHEIWRKNLCEIISNHSHTCDLYSPENAWSWPKYHTLMLQHHREKQLREYLGMKRKNEKLLKALRFGPELKGGCTLKRKIFLWSGSEVLWRQESPSPVLYKSNFKLNVIKYHSQ